MSIARVSLRGPRRCCCCCRSRARPYPSLEHRNLPDGGNGSDGCARVGGGARVRRVRRKGGHRLAGIRHPCIFSLPASAGCVLADRRRKKTSPRGVRPRANPHPKAAARSLARTHLTGDADAITVAGRCDARRRSRAWSNATLPNADLRTRRQASSAVTTPSFFHATMEGKSSCRRFARAVRSVRFRDRRARTPKCTSTPKGRARTTRVS